MRSCRSRLRALAAEVGALQSVRRRSTCAQGHFRAASELVTTAVTVRDAEGRLVTTLEQHDFIVEEDGVAQPITQFTQGARAGQPGAGARYQRQHARRSAWPTRAGRWRTSSTSCWRRRRGLAAGVQSRDAACSAPWTIERAGLRAKLDAIRPSGGTALYDAIAVSLPLFESRQHPRAALLLVSDGADTASDITPTVLKQQLVRSDVFLYAIAIDSPDARTSTRINPYTLNELTSQGGGYTEIIAATAELGPATERIAEELNHQYMIGYTPTTPRDGKYHTRPRQGRRTAAYTVRARRRRRS